MQNLLITSSVSEILDSLVMKWAEAAYRKVKPLLTGDLLHDKIYQQLLSHLFGLYLPRYFHKSPKI